MPPRIVGFYRFVCLLGLGLYAWGLHGQKHLAALPADFDPASVSYPAEVNGIGAASPAEIRFIVQGYRPGSIARIGPPGDARDVPLVPAIPFQHWLLILTESVLFWLVATFIFAPRSRDPAARDFLACTLLYGLAVAIGGVYFTGPHVHAGAFLALLQTFCLAFLPAFFLHLTLIFPRRSPWLERFRLSAAAFTLAALVVAWQTATHARYFLDPGPGAWPAIGPSLWLGDLLMVVEVALGCVLLLRSSFQAELEREQQQARWLLTGFVIGITPYVFLRTLPSLWGGSSILSSQFDRLFELAIPAAFVLAVVRHQLLDIDVIIRRGTLYAFLAATFVALYAGVALSLGRIVSRRYPQSETAIDVAVALVAVVIFNRMRVVIGHWVDRTFFKIRYDYSRALRRFRRRLGYVSDPPGLAKLLVDFIDSTVEPLQVAVVFKTGADPATSRGRLLDLDPDAAWGVARRLAGRSVHPVAAPRATSLPERERADFPEALLERGFRIVQPLRENGSAGGALLLGAKSSDRRYVELDLKLLESVANLAGRTLEKLDLIQSAAREAFERQRLDELNRLKSDFLARVAHDLRTPLASIRWSVENMADGIAGPMSDLQMEYARGMRVSASQLGRLIDNLMNLSQLEVGNDHTVIGPVDMPRVIEETLVSLKPLASSRQIEIRALVPAQVPPLRGDPVRFQEVLNNLLDNAIAFSPASATIDVILVPEEPGWWRLSVRDRGPGLNGTDPSRLFDRYVQGTPGPRRTSRGFGLGLFVVRSYIEQFGGSVSAADHPEGGAEFSCRLREWEPAPEGTA